MNYDAEKFNINNEIKRKKCLNDSLSDDSSKKFHIIIKTLDAIV